VTAFANLQNKCEQFRIRRNVPMDIKYQSLNVTCYKLDKKVIDIFFGNDYLGNKSDRFNESIYRDDKNTYDNEIENKYVENKSSIQITNNNNIDHSLFYVKELVNLIRSYATDTIIYYIEDESLTHTLNLEEKKWTKIKTAKLPWEGSWKIYKHDNKIFASDQGCICEYKSMNESWELIDINDFISPSAIREIDGNLYKVVSDENKTIAYKKNNIGWIQIAESDKIIHEINDIVLFNSWLTIISNLIEYSNHTSEMGIEGNINKIFLQGYEITKSKKLTPYIEYDIYDGKIFIIRNKIMKVKTERLNAEDEIGTKLIVEFNILGNDIEVPFIELNYLYNDIVVKITDDKYIFVFINSRYNKNNIDYVIYIDIDKLGKGWQDIECKSFNSDHDEHFEYDVCQVSLFDGWPLKDKSKKLCDKRFSILSVETCNLHLNKY